MSYHSFGDSFPRAAKDYRCHLCGEQIAKGEKHVAHRAADDGRAYTIRMHDECSKLTVEWDEWDWMYHDKFEFREQLAKARADRAKENERHAG